MGFQISVRGARFTGSYVASTASDAVRKAERHLGAATATVTIIDPRHQEWSPDQFQTMVNRWTLMKLSVV